MRVHYKGWHEKFDEWLDRRGDRVRPYGRHKLLPRKREQKLWRVPGAGAGGAPAAAASSSSSGRGIGSGSGVWRGVGKLPARHPLLPPGAAADADVDLNPNLNPAADDEDDDGDGDGDGLARAQRRQRQIDELSDRFGHYIGALRARCLQVKHSVTAPSLPPTSLPHLTPVHSRVRV